MTTDPSVIRSLAVSAEDLRAAIEANARGEAPTVLRVTPPFSGRMRARLHVVQENSDDGTVHIQPTAFLSGEMPPYPTPDETADELREDDEMEYSVDRHRSYHETQVAQWRERLLTHVVESVRVPAVDHQISVALLGP